MKGEHICHQHGRQVDNDRRRERQRRELLSRPGVGFESPGAIQRTIGELANAALTGEIDCKVLGRILFQIQTAIRLQKIAARLQRSRTRAARKRSGGPVTAPASRKRAPRKSRMIGRSTTGGDGSGDSTKPLPSAQRLAPNTNAREVLRILSSAEVLLQAASGKACASPPRVR
jgi:hypothetical protein